MLRLNAFMELKLRFIGRLFQTLTVSFTKESAMYSSTVWFKNFISMTSSLGNRTECENWLTSMSTSPKMTLYLGAVFSVSDISAIWYEYGADKHR